MSSRFVQTIRNNRLTAIAAMLLAAAVPITVLPILGSLMVDFIEVNNGIERDKAVWDDSTPVRLVTRPLINHAGRTQDLLVAVIDLPSVTAAHKMCGRSPHLNDTLQIFAAENPERTDALTRVPGRDPELKAALSARFPEIPIDTVRLTEPTAYKKIYPFRDVYECVGLGYRPLATKSEQ